MTPKIKATAKKLRELREAEKVIDKLCKEFVKYAWQVDGQLNHCGVLEDYARPYIKKILKILEKGK